jgi:tetratricopeptide (TPR) repeat protein
MGKPLAERIGALEALEKQIDRGIADSTLAGTDKGDALYYKYHLQRNLAKYPEAARTYKAYLRGIKDARGGTAAEAALFRDLTVWKHRRAYVQCASVCEVMAGEFPKGAEIEATALYHLGWSAFRMNGTMNRCVKACKELIGRHPESRWRPWGMRLLANAYLAQGEHDSALGVLAMLKEQYAGTRWEHYADMRVGIVWEKGMGDPQKGLDLYMQSLERYPDHVYGPYVQKQIARLQKVIEEQLILDALAAVARGEAPVCGMKSLIVKAGPPDKREIAAR